MRGNSAFMRIARTLLLTFVVLLMLCEAFLRFALGLGNPILIAPDQACGYIIKPDQDVFRFLVHTRINHYGMRSDPIAPVKPAGSLRILFVGDSITYGTTRVDQEKIFSEMIHRELPAIVHRPVEVLNASASAWAIDNELAFVRSRGIFSSDLVLLVLNSGDLTQPRATIADVGSALPQTQPATALGELYSRFLRPRILHLAARADAGTSAVQGRQEVVLRNLEDLDELWRLVSDGGARLAIIYIPFRHEVADGAARSAPSSLLSWCAGHRVSLLDLTFAESGNSERDVTLDGGHLNTKGNALIARSIESLWPQLSQQ